MVSAFHNVAAHKLAADAAVDCDVLVFGAESKGLPRDLTAAHTDTLLTIPSRPQVRSLNLSNCAAIVAYEALRQWAV